MTPVVDINLPNSSPATVLFYRIISETFSRSRIPAGISSFPFLSCSNQTLALSTLLCPTEPLSMSCARVIFVRAQYPTFLQTPGPAHVHRSATMTAGGRGGN